MLKLFSCSLIALAAIPSLHLCADAAIRPLPDNPHYWEINGRPNILIGGGSTSSLFQYEGEMLTDELDTLVACGGNYVRNTMGDRNPGDVHAFKQLSNGLYDLNKWNEIYWDRFRNFLEETSKRSVVVQIELWDRWDLTGKNWINHPWNPRNNINYTAEETTLSADGQQHWGGFPFWKTVTDDPTVLHFQEQYIAKILSIALQYDNVLYVITNEQDVEEVAGPWSAHWSRFITAQAEASGKTAQRSPMLVTADATMKHLLASPGAYDFVDVSQTGLEWKQHHADAVMRQRDSLEANAIPLNSVKQYGGFNSIVFSPGKADEGAARGWRTIFCGGATVRYHRPDSAGYGIGLLPKGQAHIAALRFVTDLLQPWRCEPHQALVHNLSNREPDEAYIMGDPGRIFAIYMPHDPEFPNGEADFSVGLDVSSFSSGATVRWLNIEAGTWTPEATTSNKILTLQRPTQAHWVAIVTPAADAEATPRIIFDTDLRSDCDDAGAMAMLHALADNGECTILGMVASTTGPDVIAALDAINTYYGRPDVPLGLVEGEHTFAHDDYAPGLAKTNQFPSDQTNSDAPTGSRLYRQLLNDAPDNSVTIVVVGAQTAVHQLMQTKPDHEGDGIEKSGMQLIFEKVKELVVMGGHFENTHWNEHNIHLDLKAANAVSEEWPTAIVYSGYEIGDKVLTGDPLKAFDPEENPVAMAYLLYRGTEGGPGVIGDRMSWDQTATYYAVRGLQHNDENLWTLSDPISLQFLNKGRTLFSPDPTSNRRYLIQKTDPTQVAQIINQLMIQKPKEAN